jgi:transposase
MPLAHREYAEWTPKRIENWAAQTGPSTREFVSKMMAVNTHPEQAFRACMGVISLSKRYTPERLEAACARALRHGARGYRNVKTILEKGLDKQESDSQPVLVDVSPHSNVRGATYYADGVSCAN